MKHILKLYNIGSATCAATKPVAFESQKSALLNCTGDGGDSDGDWLVAGVEIQLVGTDD